MAPPIGTEKEKGHKGMKTTKVLALRVFVVHTPPDDYVGSETEAFPSEECFQNTVRWLREKWSEIPPGVLCSTICMNKILTEQEFEEIFGKVEL